MPGVTQGNGDINGEGDSAFFIAFEWEEIDLNK